MSIIQKPIQSSRLMAAPPISSPDHLVEEAISSPTHQRTGEAYVTLFDHTYLANGLALYHSLQKYSDSFSLHIICMSDSCYNALEKLRLLSIHLYRIAEVEAAFPRLRGVKGTRSHGEYCWTVTPFAPMHVLNCHTDIPQITYVDSDVWLRSSPRPIFSEFTCSEKSILLTEHAYAPQYDQSATSGRFCVQFMVFKRDDSYPVLDWWQERCLEWCYNRVEEGKFGDQKYLDQWPNLFQDSIHILQDKELILGPWNASRFPYGNSCAWHFHGLRIVQDSFKTLYLKQIADYELPQPCRDYVYSKYANCIQQAISLLIAHGIDVAVQQASPCDNAEIHGWRLLERESCEDLDSGLLVHQDVIIPPSEQRTAGHTDLPDLEKDLEKCREVLRLQDEELLIKRMEISKLTMQIRYLEQFLMLKSAILHRLTTVIARSKI